MLTWVGTPETGATGGGASTADGDDGSGESVLAFAREQLRDPTAVTGADLPARTDRALAGTARGVVVPGRDPTVTVADLDARFRVTTATELPEGEYLLRCQSSMRAAGRGAGTLAISFDGPASVKPDGDAVAVSFWDPTPVTVGVSESAPTGPSRLTVRPTPEGVATAITHLAAAHRTDGPARSHPEFRDHPPLVRVGEETDVPADVRDAVPDGDLTFRVPRSTDALFVAAPLAYYLGARVEVEDRTRPRLSADEASVDLDFDPLPAFQHEAAQLLRRVFHLDCQVRRVAPDDGSTRDDLLAAVDLAPSDVRDRGPAGRLERYLSVPRRALDADLPEWHLSTYVAASPDRVVCLPALADRLSLVYLPRASELDRSDLLDRTLADAFPVRGGATVANVVQPDLQAGRVHAWLAPGAPIDAFKTTTRAFTNRFRYRERRRDRLRVAVVLNDRAMDAEHDTVESVYREGAANLPIDVALHERLPRADLADLLATDHDFVHYIGHCDEAGLRCPDGNLAAADLDRSRTRTFFLNACGSYREGLELVERGAIVGAVTFRDVLDSQAARVGTAFARLLVHGFCFERALQLARRRIVMGKDYAVVGDGTYALLPSPGLPAVVRLRDAPDGDYEVACEVLTARSTGARYRPPFAEGSLLNGDSTEVRLSGAELRAALEGTSIPVVYDGDVQWPDELLERL